MLKLILIIALLYLAFKARKVYRTLQSVGSRAANARIDDVMIKDPYCEVYFPKREGFHLRIDGKDLYFCSERCRDSYTAIRTQKDS